MELSVVVPCLNEEACLPAFIERLTLVLRQEPFLGRGGTEIIFVDDGSTDETKSILEKACAADACVVLERHPHNRGLAAAWRTGLECARGRLICTIDADLQYHPEDIPQLYRAVQAGADLAQGVRSDRHDPGPRRILSRGLNGILNTVFGMRLADNQSGFVLCRREVFRDVLSYHGHYGNWQNLVAVAAHVKGYNIQEVPTRFDKRFAGRSFLSDIPLRVSLSVLADVTRGFAEYRLGI